MQVCVVFLVSVLLTTLFLRPYGLLLMSFVIRLKEPVLWSHSIGNKAMPVQTLKVDTLRLKALIEIRKDQKGSDYYLVTTSLGKLRFTIPSSLNDFLTHNDLGYVE